MFTPCSGGIFPPSLGSSTLQRTNFLFSSHHFCLSRSRSSEPHPSPPYTKRRYQRSHAARPSPSPRCTRDFFLDITSLFFNCFFPPHRPQVVPCRSAWISFLLDLAASFVVSKTSRFTSKWTSRYLFSPLLVLWCANGTPISVVRRDAPNFLVPFPSGKRSFLTFSLFAWRRPPSPSNLFPAPSRAIFTGGQSIQALLLFFTISVKRKISFPLSGWSLSQGCFFVFSSPMEVTVFPSDLLFFVS